jgi:hypothetical protein
MLTVAGWCILRSVAGAKLTPGTGLAVDCALPLLGFALLFAATARPIFTGATLFALIAAFSTADRIKRKTLLEPIIFVDVYQTVDVMFRHPELNVLRLGSWKAACGGLVVAGLLLAGFLWDSPVWLWSIWPGITAAMIAVAAGWSIAGPLLNRSSAFFLRLGPTADPIRDSVILGPFAVHAAYALIARAERPRRRAAVLPSAVNAPMHRCSNRRSPVVVVQCESFFDPRRLHPAIPSDLLPVFDACCMNGVQSGRLSVPCVGANSVRTEFAVLTGLAEAEIGFDRFNPYLCFARAPIQSLAWRMRAEGYRTICVHPFDPRFYRRDLVMKNLGFDAFIGDEGFSRTARPGHYVTDVEVARRIADILRDEGPSTFVFAITMENHGPWPSVAGPPNLTRGLFTFPGHDELDGFLHGIKGADAMLGILTEILRPHGDAAALAFYGDHLPNLHSVFAGLAFSDWQSDYLIWSPAGGNALTLDLTAQELSRAIWDTCVLRC